MLRSSTVLFLVPQVSEIAVAARVPLWLSTSGTVIRPRAGVAWSKHKRSPLAGRVRDTRIGDYRRW